MGMFRLGLLREEFYVSGTVEGTLGFLEEECDLLDPIKG
jgi:hypothetical protein